MLVRKGRGRDRAPWRDVRRGRRCPWPRGEAGGGTGIAASRGQRRDVGGAAGAVGDWASAAGREGQGEMVWRSVRPRGPGGHETVDRSWGSGGRVKISDRLAVTTGLRFRFTESV